MDNNKEGKKQIPAVQGWFAMPPEEFHIFVNKCGACGDMSFPPDGACRNPKCAKDQDTKTVTLKGTGKLVTFTINHYPPPPPYHKTEDFKPFGVAFVNMDEGIAMKAMVAQGFEESLEVGMEMEAVLEKLYDDDEGNEVMIHKFRPVNR